MCLFLLSPSLCGVLNTSVTGALNDELLQLLAQLVAKSKANIILSTSWRVCDSSKKQLIDALAPHGLNDIVIGSTPDMKGQGSRSDEIVQFLWDIYATEVSKLAQFVCLDDMDLTRGTSRTRFALKGHCVKTDETVGLTEEDCASALQILQSEFNSVEWMKLAEALRGNDVIDDGNDEKSALENGEVGEGDESELEELGREFFLKSA